MTNTTGLMIWWPPSSGVMYRELISGHRVDWIVVNAPIKRLYYLPLPWPFVEKTTMGNNSGSHIS